MIFEPQVVYVTVSVDDEIIISIEEQEEILVEADVTVTHGEYDTYDGSYEITPRTYPQTLETENKMMSDNVLVHKIPFSKVSNIHNGFTVNIGG